MDLYLYNTLGRKKEKFNPISKEEVKIYTCGPTVYNYAHIGNLRSYVFADILVRTLKYFNYEVKQVINITDIGHLSSDADSGEDKMTKALLREGKELNLENMRAVAEFYTEKFKEDLEALNIKLPEKLLFASDFLKEDIELVKKLVSKGFTYQTSDGIYFNIIKMPDYGALWGGKRIYDENQKRITKNLEKKNPEDFALWKFNNEIGFPSPWGQGFPGWHIECSAMSMHELGEQFDIHTGGIDHIPIHHTNEIAQSECATGKKPFVRYWMHNEFVDIGSAKMAKADDNFFKLNSLIEKNINPLAYRFWLLMANYRTKMNFNWDAVEGTAKALENLQNYFYLELGEKKGTIEPNYQRKFAEFLADDLNTPSALTLIWELMKDQKISPADKKATLSNFDLVLGLNLDNYKIEIPEEIIKLGEARKKARQEKEYKKSDELREKINSLGFQIKDLEDDTFTIWKK